MFGFQMRMTTVARARSYLYRLLTEKDPAKEVRAFGLGDYLNTRHNILYERHMTELRKTTRKRFRIAVVSTLGLAAGLGAGMAGLLALALSGRLELAETATAALDPRAEHDLFSRIRTLYKGRTVLLISHRYNTVRDADHIYVLDRGRIIEHGRHDQLIAQAGTYAELFSLQAAAYTDQPSPNGSDLPHQTVREDA